MSFLKSVLLSGSLLVGSTMGWTMSCGEGEKLINGICFQDEVKNLVYENVGFSGTYDTITSMIDGLCSVSSAPYSFSGPLAPLNEEITWHFRGPIELNKFAVYYPSSSDQVKKKEKREAAAQRSHVVRHSTPVVKREPALKMVTDYVFVTKVVDADSVTDPTPAVDVYSSPKQQKPKNKGHNHHHHHHHKHKHPKKNKWQRVAYYNADEDSLEGLTFMNNQGSPSLSGAWTSCFGNTLSFMSSDGLTAAAQPNCLKPGTMIPSNKEFSIWSSTKCGSNCGYSNPGTPAYEGFSGDNKVFIFRFQMPSDSSSSVNSNMPAVWALNSKIGRTQQYPAKTAWSCWESGCGEIDIWEVLSPESWTYMKSHLHSKQGAVNGYGGGGSGHYFARPVDKFMNGAVAFTADGKVTITVLPDDYKFPKEISLADIKAWRKDAKCFTVPS